MIYIGYFIAFFRLVLTRAAVSSCRIEVTSGFVVYSVHHTRERSMAIIALERFYLVRHMLFLLLHTDSDAVLIVE